VFSRSPPFLYEVRWLTAEETPLGSRARISALYTFASYIGASKIVWWSLQINIMILPNILPRTREYLRHLVVSIYSRTRDDLLHVGVSLTLLFIILCACSLWVVPSQKWQLGLVAGSGSIVILSSVILFLMSTYDKWPSTAADRNFAVRFFLRLRGLFDKYNVNHRNTAFVIIITVPLLMLLYVFLWSDQMHTYAIQATTEPLVCTTPDQFHLLQ
jgi:hypothetical protein